MLYDLVRFGGMGLSGMEENKKSASPKKTAPVAHRTVSCSSAGAGGDSATTVD